MARFVTSGTCRAVIGRPRTLPTTCDAEIRAKIGKGTPSPTRFSRTPDRPSSFRTAAKSSGSPLSEPPKVADLLNAFYAHTKPDIEGFKQAVEHFKERIPDLARSLNERIVEAHKTNSKFKAAFADFFELCQQSLNPNISREAVDEMLVQHLLTERLFRTIFDNADFTKRNVIAVEIERVIEALASQSFSRARIPAKPRPLLQGDRRRRPRPRRLERQAALPQHGLRAVLPGLLGQGCRHARASSTRRRRSSTSCAPASRRS